MNVVLLGQTGVGKDFMMKKVVEKYNLKKITTYTTRPIREGEVDGETYHFVSKKKFEKMLGDGKFFEHQEYQTTHGVWYYGTSYESILDTNTIIILDRDGLVEYKKRVPHCISVYLSVFDDTEQFYRATSRLGDVISRKDIDEVYRRIMKDREKFKSIHDLVDFTIPQIYNDTTISLMFDLLNKLGVEKRRNDGNS